MKNINISIKGQELNKDSKLEITSSLQKTLSQVLDYEYDDVMKCINIDYEIPQEESKQIPLKIKGYIEKSSEEDRIIAGYASVIEIDKENQLIPKETLQKGIETLLKDSKYSNLMLMHKNIQVGTILDKWKKLKTHVDEHGLYIVARIRKDLEIANQVWNKILNKDFNGFSISGEVTLTHKECDDSKCWEVVDHINIFEVSVCDKPINSKSGFIIISKSEEEDFTQNNENVCTCNKNFNIGEKSMKKDKEKSTIEEEDTKEEETKEKPQEEPKKEPEETEKSKVEEEKKLDTEIDKLTREVEALKATISELTKQEDYDEEEGDVPGEQDVGPDEYEDDEMEEKSEDELLNEAINTLANLMDISSEKIKESLSSIEVKSEECEECEEEEKSIPNEKTFNELKDSVDKILEEFSKVSEIDDLKKSIKSKDDQISALTKRLEIVEKSEVKPETVIEKDDDEEESEKIVQDAFRPGTFYKSVD